MTHSTLFIRSLGLQPYLTSWQAMQAFTQQRDEDTLDECWLLEHEPVFTQGQNGKPEHLLHPGTIPLVQADRGGQITYHGPGQLMAYTLIDLRRKKLTIRAMVSALENALIQLLYSYGISAFAKREAPGVYVNQQKIASVGLRIRRGCSYHGLALNVAMDLNPFLQINPCGFSALKMTQLSALGGPSDLTQVGRTLVEYLAVNLGYTTSNFIE